MKVRHYIFCVICFCFCFTTWEAIGQSPNYFTIGAQELKGQDVYSINFHDELIYASTNRGLYKFQYNSFVKISFRDGKDKSIFDIKEDRKGNLFCKSLDGVIYKLREDTLVPFFTLPSRLKTGFFYFFFTEKNELLLVSNGVYLVDSLGKLSHTDPEFEGIQTFYCHRISDNKIFISSDFEEGISLIYNQGNFEKIQNQAKGEKIISGDNFLFEKDSSQFKLNKKGFFYSPTNSKIGIATTLGENFHYINDNKVIARSDKAGLKELFIRNDSLLEGGTFFQDEFFSFVFQDNSGILYLGTFGEGIRVVPVYTQQNTVIEDELKSICVTNSNELFVNTRAGILYKYTGKLTESKEVNPNTNRIFESSFGVGNDFQQKHRIVYESEKRVFSSLKDVYNVNDSTFLYVDNVTAGIVSKANFVPTNFTFFTKLNGGVTFMRYQNKARFKAVASDDISTKILVAGVDGVFNLITDQEITHNGNSIFANDLIIYEHNLIVGTKNQGVWLMNDSVLTRRIDMSTGLLSNEIIKLKLVGDQLYILCAVGLQKYNLKNNTLYTFGIKDGVFSDRIKDFDANVTSIFILEKNSFYPVSIPHLSSELSFKVDSIFVGKKMVQKSEINKFSDADNSLRIRMSNANIVTSSESYYRYFLEGFDEAPRQLNSRQSVISYPFLPSGSYVFRVSLNRGENSSQEYSFAFTIPLPFYQQWWFILLIVVLLVCVIFLLMRFRFNKIAKKNQQALEKETMAKSLLDSELKALRSQMNPHFMFNSLNSIQNLILSEKVDKAYDYVVSFSELVRNTLNYSKEEFIPIENELEFLEVYLKLEKLRFKKDFTYRIQSSVPANIQIPSLLLQPFIENSLKHGLMHKKGLKQMDIIFSYTDKLTCVVRDNGIGRKKAEELKQNRGTRHTSFAMESIGKRLEILSERYGGRFFYKVKDLEENGEPSGTEIEINLPFKQVN